MEKTIVFSGYNSDFIIYKGEKYDYTSYSGRIYCYFEITKLLLDENYYNEIVNILKFNKYEINYSYSYRRKRLFIPVSKELIEYYTTKDEFKNNREITLSNNNLSNNVNSFYEFDLFVEIEGVENKKFGRIGDFGTEICIPSSDFLHPNLLDDDQLKNKMIELFGEPKVHPQNESDKYGRFSKEFFIPKSKIKRIIGIKKYRDISTIGQPNGEQFTGETEEFILDLHNFDENIYKIFEEHKMLEIENIE
ncbi:hypothetical protein CAPN004_23180 [Capnocytophaga cynodegmi]|uniref:hypothetical protein n=1 Tax=Capnocytophaga cynodegmi TaxID=28189 RepID=UPI001AC290EB|nr:hypothetical protein [Capnocytophaga cynodegmi]GIM53289.1 hypothetical protein CAPN004_23180 [Capnocytophaga cynodegmi]